MVRKTICFVAKDIYTPLIGEGDMPYGGSEIKISNFINTINSNNINISVICKVPKNVTRRFEINGIKVYPWNYPNIKIKYLTSLIFYFRLLFLLHKVKSKVFISQNANILIFITAFYSKLFRRTFIHWISHYFDTLKANRKGMNPIDFYLYKIGLKMSDITIVQTKEQKESLFENYRKRCTLIRNGHHINTKINNINGSEILWVGRLKKSKQPHLFINLARNFPNHHFVIAGTMDNSFPDYINKLKEDISVTKNLTYIGQVPYSEIPSLFQKGMIFVSTSIGEGFSNTFIEAWNHNIPVVTLNHDPDQCIKKYKLGIHSETFDKLIEDFKTLINDEELRSFYGDNGKAYVRMNHDIIKTSDEFYKLIQNL